MTTSVKVSQSVLSLYCEQEVMVNTTSGENHKQNRIFRDKKTVTQNPTEKKEKPTQMQIQMEDTSN